MNNLSFTPETTCPRVSDTGLREMSLRRLTSETSRGLFPTYRYACILARCPEQLQLLPTTSKSA